MADQNAGVFRCDGCGRTMTYTVFAVGGPTPVDAFERRPPPPRRQCGGTSCTRTGDAPDPNAPPPPAPPVGVPCPANGDAQLREFATCGLWSNPKRALARPRCG